MLILTRKVGEAIILDDDIEITLMDIQGNHTKIGIDAPKEIKILRKELKKDTWDYIVRPYGQQATTWPTSVVQPDSNIR